MNNWHNNIFCLIIIQIRDGTASVQTYIHPQSYTLHIFATFNPCYCLPADDWSNNRIVMPGGVIYIIFQYDFSQKPPMCSIYTLHQNFTSPPTSSSKKISPIPSKLYKIPTQFKNSLRHRLRRTTSQSHQNKHFIIIWQFKIPLYRLPSTSLIPYKIKQNSNSPKTPLFNKEIAPKFSSKISSHNLT